MQRFYNKPIETYEFNITTSQVKSLCHGLHINYTFTTIQLIPSDGSTSYVRKLTVISSSTEDNGEKSPVGTATPSELLPLFSSVSLSNMVNKRLRRRGGRDIFEYCPACDGELGR